MYGHDYAVRFEYNLTTYMDMLSKFREAGYTPSLFSDEGVSGWSAYLRHDIDVSLERALQMARAERERGWFATYFVLLDTEFYNALSRRGRSVLKQISDLGHAIGLHFDEVGLPQDPVASEDRLSSELSVLEDIVGRPIGVVAPHRPTRRYLGMDDRIAGRPHPYQPRFFHQATYVSDSLGGWLNGHPLDRVDVTSGCPIQILTHPYIWTSPTVITDQRERLMRVIGERREDLQLQLSANFKCFG